MLFYGELIFGYISTNPIAVIQAVMEKERQGDFLEKTVQVCLFRIFQLVNFLVSVSGNFNSKSFYISSIHHSFFSVVFVESKY